MTRISDELKMVSSIIKKRIDRPGGMTEQELMSLVTRPDADPAAYHPDQATFRDVATFNDVSVEHERIGEEAIKAGEVAFVVLGGGSGTRSGGPKVMLKIPEIGTSLLGWKLLQAGEMPVWVMSSPDLAPQIQQHISTFALPTGMRGVIFDQFEGYRLKPDNSISWTQPSIPELHTLGHGDLGPALVEAGILDDNPDVKRIVVCNVDNVMASPHSGIIGHHIQSGKSLTCELVERQKGDRGGVLAWVNNKLQIAEDFRLPEGFAEHSLFFNTNTMVIDVDVLKWQIPWRWHRVRKHVNNRVVVQYERLLQQYTEECDANFLVVPRDARYLGIKVPEDLKRASDVLSTYQFK